MREKFAGERLSFETVASRESGTRADAGQRRRVPEPRRIRRAAARRHRRGERRPRPCAAEDSHGRRPPLPRRERAAGFRRVSGAGLRPGGLRRPASGGALGVAVQAALPSVFRGLLPLPVDFSIAWGAVARGHGGGIRDLHPVHAAPAAGDPPGLPAGRAAGGGGGARGQRGSLGVRRGRRDRGGRRGLRRLAGAQRAGRPRIRGRVGPVPRRSWRAWRG